MDEFVSKIWLELNGQEITDFNKVQEGKRELRAAVNLMNKTGFLRKTTRYTVTVDYVEPADNPEFDFESVENGTLTIDKGNGVRITYTGVCCLEIGDVTFDGEKEATPAIQFGASGRVVN